MFEDERFVRFPASTPALIHCQRTNRIENHKMNVTILKTTIYGSFVDAARGSKLAQFLLGSGYSHPDNSDVS